MAILKKLIYYDLRAIKHAQPCTKFSYQQLSGLEEQGHGLNMSSFALTAAK